MTVKEVYNETVTLLGINDYGENLNNSDVFQKNFLCCLNKVILDLFDTASDIKSLSGTIDLPAISKSALCNGTAMWLALILGDAQKQAFFANVYSSMRTRSKSTLGQVADTMPR